MDNEMIDRVAKAIFEKRYEAHGTFQNLKWEDYKAKYFYLEDAKQAITAMQVPTDKMSEAGKAQCFIDDSPSSIYIAMIGCITNV